MRFPIEVVENIVSSLPVETYNEIFGTDRVGRLYDTVPERITMMMDHGGKILTRWHRPGTSTVKIYDLEEVKAIYDGTKMPPFFPSRSTILELDYELFLELNLDCTELLKEYKIHLNPAEILKLPKKLPYDIEYRVLRLPEVADATTHLMVRPGAGLVVANKSVKHITLYCSPSEEYDRFEEKGWNIDYSDSDREWDEQGWLASGLEAPPRKKRKSFGQEWRSVSKEEGDAFLFNDLNLWDVPRLTSLEIKDPAPSIKRFHYHGPLTKLCIENVQIKDLPDFSSFNLKELTVRIAKKGTIDFNLPDTLTGLVIFGSDSVLDADFEFPPKLASLELHYVNVESELPPTLTRLEITADRAPTMGGDSACDFTKMSSLRKLKLQAKEYVQVKLPPSLKLLEITGRKSCNLQELVELEDLNWKLQHESNATHYIQELVLPPNLIKCRITSPVGHLIRPLKLNDTLRVLNCDGCSIDDPITLPETLQLLTLSGYKHHLDFPEGLEHLEMDNQSSEIEVPKHLKSLILELNRSRRPELDLKLNQELKLLDVSGYKLDFWKMPLPPSLEYLSLYLCKIDERPTDIVAIEESQGVSVDVYRRYDFYGT